MNININIYQTFTLIWITLHSKHVTFVMKNFLVYNYIIQQHSVLDVTKINKICEGAWEKGPLGSNYEI